jgi:ComF family protein
MELFTRAFTELIDLLVPQKCGYCGAPTAHHGEQGLCGTCREAIEALPSLRCERCDLPELQERGARLLGIDGLCLLCRGDPERPITRSSAQFSGDVLPSLLVRLKYGGEAHLARPLAQLMWRAACEHYRLENFDAVVPVPLHDRRLVSRGFNQSVLLCAPLCRRSGLPLLNGLKRVSTTPSQARLRATDRALNLRGSFIVRRRSYGGIEGRRLLLVDDVVTTGWTVRECARTLTSNGAAAVAVLCLGRTPRSR